MVILYRHRKWLDQACVLIDQISLEIDPTVINRRSSGYLDVLSPFQHEGIAKHGLCSIRVGQWLKLIAMLKHLPAMRGQHKDHTQNGNDSRKGEPILSYALVWIRLIGRNQAWTRQVANAECFLNPNRT